MKYVVVQGCPCPALFAPYLKKFLAESGATLESCYRGADAEALLHKLGKHSQRELYEMWLRRAPGANPANPPGQSTHELRSDGVPYPGPLGRRLKWWQVGLDIDDAHVDAFIRVAKRHGWNVIRPYSAGSEWHHVNVCSLRLHKRIIAHLHVLPRNARLR